MRGACRTNMRKICEKDRIRAGGNGFSRAHRFALTALALSAKICTTYNTLHELFLSLPLSVNELAGGWVGWFGALPDGGADDGCGVHVLFVIYIHFRYLCAR